MNFYFAILSFLAVMSLYLTILTFFLAIMILYLAILTSRNYEFLSQNSDFFLAIMYLSRNSDFFPPQILGFISQFRFFSHNSVFNLAILTFISQILGFISQLLLFFHTIRILLYISQLKFFFIVILYFSELQAIYSFVRYNIFIQWQK